MLFMQSNLHETARAQQLDVQSQSTERLHLPLPVTRAGGSHEHRWLITAAKLQTRSRKDTRSLYLQLI